MEIVKSLTLNDRVHYVLHRGVRMKKYILGITPKNAAINVTSLNGDYWFGQLFIHADAKVSVLGMYNRRGVSMC